MTKQKDKHNLKTSFVKIGDNNIRYTQKGKGKDILLIHGMPGSIEDWKEIINPLSKHFRVTAFDRLGHGHSSAKNYTYHIQDNAILVEKIIETLNLVFPYIVGHSYGGSIVANLAAKYNFKNFNFMIVDSPLYGYDAEFKFKLVATPIIGKLLAFISSFTIAKSEIKKGVSVLFSSLEKEKIDELVAERQELWKQVKVIYSKSKESVNYGNDLQKQSMKYKKIEAKITIVTANNFPGTYGNDCKKFHSEVLNSKLVVLENTGHYIQLEKIKELIQIIISENTL